jgi:hypothetical protein
MRAGASDHRRRVDALISDALQQRRNVRREQKLALPELNLAFCHCVGRVAEWFKAAVLKTARGFTLPRGFESHPFRQA